MYSLLRRMLFLMPPEIAHEVSLDGLCAAERLKLLKLFLPAPVIDPIRLMGISFPNRVGLAAGLDKNGDYINGLGALGFGFIEIGTITPRPQPGNPLPRLFRIPEAEAIVNRMGFNNLGLQHLVRRVKERRWKGVLGINIGKNLDTPVNTAVNDYLDCMELVYPYADYITINISSPNTPGLRDLQQGMQLTLLLKRLKTSQERLTLVHGRKVPLVVKIAPDMDDDGLRELADVLLESDVEGVIATNTTVNHEAVAHLPYGLEAGGLSGGPLTHRSTQVIALLSERLEKKIPIIGVGGILSGHDAADKISAGASLVQLYSGFIYRGPALIRDVATTLRNLD